MDGKQRYYAALERQQAAEASLASHLGKETVNGSHKVESLEALYTDMGMRALGAFNNFLDFVSEFGRRSALEATDPAANSRTLHRAVEEVLGDRLAETSRLLNEVNHRLNRFETSLATLEAGLKRIDKFTLDAFRNGAQLDRQIADVVARIDRLETEGTAPEALNRRLPKEKARELAIEAAADLARSGERLTLAAIARAAGLKYGQIMYAFGNKEAFFAALEETAGQVVNGDEPRPEVDANVSVGGEAAADGAALGTESIDQAV